MPSLVTRLPSREAAPVAAEPRFIALIVASALFMEQLDGTVLTNALPTMARSFGVDPLHMSVALTSYLLSLAVLIPASGPFADRFGSRTVFCLALLLFTLGSVACGLAPNLPVLVAARILQGVGGAMMVPVGRLVLLRATPKAELLRAMSWMMVPATIGPILGPPLGGLIVTYVDWRWIFAINVPIGALGIVLASRLFDNVREPVTPRFDFRGIVLSGAALCSLTIAFEMIGRSLGPWPAALALVMLGLAIGAVYVRHAGRVANPVLDFRLMRIPTFRLSVLSGSIARVAVGGMPFLLPMMLQIGFHMTAAESGLATLGTAAGSLLMRLGATVLLRRFGYRNVLIWMGFVAIGLYAVCAAFRPGWPFVVIQTVLLAQGFFQAIMFISFNTIAYADVPAARMSAATSFYTTFQQIMLAFGVAFAASVLGVVTLRAGHAAPTPGDFSLTILIVAGVSALAPVLASGLDPEAGAQMSGHRAGQPVPEPAE